MKLDALKQRVKENFHKNKIALLIISIIWIVLALVTVNNYKTTIGKLATGNDIYDRSVVEITKDTIVEQDVPTEDGADSISILFATYSRTNSGNVTLQVIGNDSKEVYIDDTFPTSSVIDNDYRTYGLEDNLDSKVDSSLHIKITSDSEPDTGIGVYYSNAKYFEEGSFYINGEQYENSDLAVKFLSDYQPLLDLTNSIELWSIIGISLIILIILLINPKPEILFTISLFILGLIMMIAIVPGAAPDELSHYEVALKLSNMIMFKDPNTIDEIYLKYGYMYGNYNISAGYLRFVQEINQPLKMTGNVVAFGRDITDIYLIQYIPQALGLTFGRLLGLNMITTFYCGRLFSLLFYVLCVWYAIKVAPTFKFIIGTIASMPMFIQTGIAISYDDFIFGLTFIIFGYFLKWYFSKDRITIKDFIIVVVACSLLAPAKVLYGFFAFIFWFIPNERFGSKRNKIIGNILICGFSIYQLLSIMYGPIIIFMHRIIRVVREEDNLILVDELKNTFGLIASGFNSTGVDAVKNKEVYSFFFMVRNPIETIEIFVRTIRYKIKYWFYGSIGRSLAGDSLILPIKLVHIMVAVLFASLFVEQDFVLSKGIKVIFVLMCIVVGLYALVGMFVSWTDSDQEIIKDYGGVIIEGIQGRYFSPLLPFLFSIFPNKKIKLPKFTQDYIYIVYLLVYFEVIMYVLSYTFVY